MDAIQAQQREWSWQWENFQDHEEWLFWDWISPNTPETFHGKRVLDAGCGGGQHLSFVAPHSAQVVGMDLNASHVARERTQKFSNVECIEGDIAKASFTELFDIVYCVGVIHHTDSPDATFANLARATKSGGRTIIWCYSKEGNALNEYLLEPLKRWIFLKLPKSVLRIVSKIMTAGLYPFVYTIYFLPLPFLPYYQYFQNFRKLSFERNDLNVFDKLNAPQTFFITQSRIRGWFESNGYRDIQISPYKGVSWRGTGIKN